MGDEKLEKKVEGLPTFKGDWEEFSPGSGVMCCPVSSGFGFERVSGGSYDGKQLPEVYEPAKPKNKPEIEEYKK